jgi:hypothetical protein
MKDMREYDMAAGVLTPAGNSTRERRSMPDRLLRFLLRWGLPVGILVVLGCLLFSQLSFGELVGVLNRAQPGWLFVGLLFYVLTNMLRAARMVQPAWSSYWTGPTPKQ